MVIEDVRNILILWRNFWKIQCISCMNAPWIQNCSFSNARVLNTIQKIILIHAINVLDSHEECLLFACFAIEALY